MDKQATLLDLALFAVIVGVAVCVACVFWGRINDLSGQEAASLSLDLWSAEFDQTVEDLAANRRPRSHEEAKAEIDALTALDQPGPWPADHPIWSGLIAAGVVLVIGRILVFMHRMERRT